MNGCDGKCVLAKGEKRVDVLFPKSLYTLYIIYACAREEAPGKDEGQWKARCRALGWLWQRAWMGVARGCGSVPWADRANGQMVLLHQFHP